MVVKIKSAKSPNRSGYQLFSSKPQKVKLRIALNNSELMYYQSVKRILQKLLKLIGFTILKSSELKRLHEKIDILRNLMHVLDLLQTLPLSVKSKFLEIYINSYKESRSQILQDIFVLTVLNEKKSGFFVEAGALDGEDCSNSYLLEKKYEWSGLLLEPSRISFKKIAKTRNAMALNLALFSISNQTLDFRETVSLGLSSLAEFSENDYMAKHRINKNLYKVESISLYDALKKVNAPKLIDYLSLDTEGSEFEILKPFNFQEYRISVISVEHAFSDQREKIYDLLTNSGFQRVMTGFSKYDDWYLSMEIIEKLRKNNITLN